jgi:hypothetical protein
MNNQLEHLATNSKFKTNKCETPARYSENGCLYLEKLTRDS